MIGYHTTTEAPGAWRNGTRVRKRQWEAGDAHPLSAEGAILGSLGPVDGAYGYFIEWDFSPGRAVFIAGHRIEPLVLTAPRAPSAGVPLRPFVGAGDLLSVRLAPAPAPPRATARHLGRRKQ